jgi:hypothetical protein
MDITYLTCPNSQLYFTKRDNVFSIIDMVDLYSIITFSFFKSVLFGRLKKKVLGENFFFVFTTPQLDKYQIFTHIQYLFA